MTPTVKAILARCGSTTAAIQYCDSVAKHYPHLKKEYEDIIVTISLEIKKASAAYAG